ncbi:MAG: glycosyltransferase family 39 protein [Ignavibacteria bacterium]|nr:glycosyltransferase family 39 protein [Ignavibacteria bacterium]
MTKVKIRLFSYILYLLVIFPIIFLPINLDYSIFLLGGEILSKGGKLYVDFIDIKPPFVYYFFSLLYSLLNKHFLLIQLFNSLFLYFSAIIFFEFILIRTNSKFFALLSPLPMLLYFSSLHYHHLFQLELFFVLFYFLVISLLFIYKEHRFFHFIILGFLSGISFAIKYPLGLIIFPIFLYLNRHSANFKKPGSKIVLFASFFITSLLSFFPLFLSTETAKGFFHILNFLTYYQRALTFNIYSLQFYVTYITNLFGIFYSLFFVIPSVYGIWRTIGNWNNLPVSEKKLHHFLLWSLLFLTLSIVLERQFFYYHFHRIIPILSFYTVYGFKFAYEDFLSFTKKVRVALVLVLLFVFPILSPLPRYFKNFLTMIYYFTDSNKYENFLENPETAFMLYKQNKEIAGFLNEKISRDDLVVIVGFAPQIYTMLKDCKKTAFPVSIFMLSEFKPPTSWREKFLDELNKAKFLILQDKDQNYFFGRPITSYNAFLEKTEYRKILESQYGLVFQTNSFFVFQRKED